MFVLIGKHCVAAVKLTSRQCELCLADRGFFDSAIRLASRPLGSDRGLFGSAIKLASRPLRSDRGLFGSAIRLASRPLRSDRGLSKADVTLASRPEGSDRGLFDRAVIKFIIKSLTPGQTNGGFIPRPKSEELSE